MLSGFLRQRHVCCLGRTNAPRGLPEVVLDEAQLAIQCRVAACVRSTCPGRMGSPVGMGRCAREGEWSAAGLEKIPNKARSTHSLSSGIAVKPSLVPAVGVCPSGQRERAVRQLLRVPRLFGVVDVAAREDKSLGDDVRSRFD